MTVPADHPVREDDRLVRLNHVHNFRDLGGYPTVDGRVTRWQTLYRADGLYRLSPEDLDVLRPLNLRTVVDLRTHGELTERGTFPVDDHPVTFIHLPIIDTTWEGRDDLDYSVGVAEFLLHRYVEMFEAGEQRVADAIRVLAEADAYPAVFHCAAGKDRTGIVAAAVLALLGVPDAVIVADYSLTRPAMVRMQAWVERHHPELAVQYSDAPAAYIDAHPDAMAALLDLIRLRHGSMAAYLATLGVAADVVERLRAALLVEPGAPGSTPA